MRRRLLVVLPIVLAALAAAAGSSLGSTPAGSVLLQGNLLQNPGAEAGSCSADGSTPLPIADWTTTGSFTVACYGGQGLPTPAFASSIGGGQHMFYGGEEPTTTATQSVDVSAAAGGIDSGAARANLSAYLGGYASQDDNMVITATFLSGSGGVLGSPLQVGPVTAADRADATELRQRSASAAVPAGTRSIRVTMTATRTEGFFNDATADNLTLTVTRTNGYGNDCPVPPLAGGTSRSLINPTDTWVMRTLSPSAHGPVISFADHKRQLRRLTAADDGRAPAARVPSPGLPSPPGSWTGAGYLSATVACGTLLDKTLEDFLHEYQAGNGLANFEMQMTYIDFRGRTVYSVHYYHAIVVSEDRNGCSSMTGTNGHTLFCVSYTLQYERRKTKPRIGTCRSRSKAGCTTRRRP